MVVLIAMKLQKYVLKVYIKINYTLNYNLRSMFSKNYTFWEIEKKIFRFLNFFFNFLVSS
jgi:hypothetical protein